SAESVSVTLPLDSLFKRDRPLLVFVDQPVVRITPRPKEPSAAAKPKFSYPLPFAIEKCLVRGGEVSFLGPKESFQVRGLKASLAIKEGFLSLRADASEATLFLKPHRKPLQGTLKLRLENRGYLWQLNKFVLSGPDVLIKGKGTLSERASPQGEFQVSYNADMEALARILGLPFAWQGRIEGDAAVTRAQKEIAVSASLTSGGLKLNGVPLERVRGRANFSPRRGIRLDMDIHQRTGLESVHITYSGGRAAGEFSGFRLDPILSYARVPWPVASPAWGKFVLDERQVVADLELREPALAPPPDRISPLGPIHFSWDRKKEFAFSSPQLETSFGRWEVNGKYNLDHGIDLTIKGEASDVKAAREFTSQILSQKLDFPEIRGRGQASISISGADGIQTRIEFAFSSAGFDEFNVAAASGTVEVRKNSVLAKFRVDDPFFRGNIDLSRTPEGLLVDIALTEGRLEKILPPLKIDLPLSGNVAADLQVRSKDKKTTVEGDFSSPLLKLAGRDLRSVKGKIFWDGKVIAFPELALDISGGRVRGSWRMEVASGTMAVDAAGEKINLSSLWPDLSGELSLSVKGEGERGVEFARGQFDIKALRFASFQVVNAQGDLRLRLLKDRLSVSGKGNLTPGENEFSVDATVPFGRDGLSIDVKGSFANLDILLPWRGAKGRLNYLAEVRGTTSAPQVNGIIDLQGPLLPFPQFAQAVTDYAGTVFIKNNTLSLRSFKGKLGGGDIQGTGEVTLKKGGKLGIDFLLDGKSLVLSPLERTRASTDASLRLFRDSSRFVLEGNFNIRRLLWRREIFERLTFSSSPYPRAQAKPGFFDDLTLNLRLRADDNAWMENSLGRIRGRFDLTVTGSIKAPILLGNIESVGGEVYFQDRKFQILRGRVSFFNPAMIEPYLDFRAETYVKDYRVTITLTGLANQLRPEFASSPPLPPEDVVALLALGEAFKRTYSTETTTQMSTASLLSFTLTEEAQKRAERLFSLDRLRIDPFLLGSSSAEMTARLTVGKKISRDFYISYSTNLTRQTEEIIRLEWDLSNELSIIGTRNEIGRLSFDVKIRRRF
ncbi:MAG: translocation/assembly module TamB domain-containing protein, partial [Acidobacteriota bacterium]